MNDVARLKNDLQAHEVDTYGWYRSSYWDHVVLTLACIYAMGPRELSVDEWLRAMCNEQLAKRIENELRGLNG